METIFFKIEKTKNHFLREKLALLSKHGPGQALSNMIFSGREEKQLPEIWKEARNDEHKPFGPQNLGKEKFQITEDIEDSRVFGRFAVILLIFKWNDMNFKTLIKTNLIINQIHSFFK